MKSRIKSVTIITAAHTKTYTVGETYNGLKLHEIKNASQDFDDMCHIEFAGQTEQDKQGVFSAINVPCEVQYEAVED